MNRFFGLLLAVFFVGCIDRHETTVAEMTEQLNRDEKIKVVPINVRFCISYQEQASLDQWRSALDDVLKYLNNKKIIAVVDVPAQGGASGVEIIYTDDVQTHSYYCDISKSADLKNLVAATSISGWRGTLSYYFCICDRKVSSNDRS